MPNVTYFFQTLSLQASSPLWAKAGYRRQKWLNLQGWWKLWRRGDKATIQGIPSAHPRPPFGANTFLPQLLGTWNAEGSQIGLREFSHLRWGHLSGVDDWLSPLPHFDTSLSGHPSSQEPHRISWDFSFNHLASTFCLPHPLRVYLLRYLPTEPSMWNLLSQSWLPGNPKIGFPEIRAWGGLRCR